MLDGARPASCSANNVANLGNQDSTCLIFKFIFLKLKTKCFASSHASTYKNIYTVRGRIRIREKKRKPETQHKCLGCTGVQWLLLWTCLICRL